MWLLAFFTHDIDSRLVCTVCTFEFEPVSGAVAELLFVLAFGVMYTFGALFYVEVVG